MSRSPDPSRKPELLAAIVDYLLDKPLATLSFRTVAAGLAVSTYSLVYHFGTRDQLLHEVMGAVAERQDVVMPTVEAERGDIGEHVANIRRSWRLGLQPRSRQLLRLEFEAAMLESRETGPTRTRRMFARWHGAGAEALTRIGLARDEAVVEARVIVDTMYGLQYDLLVSGDEERASAAFERAIDGYERRLRSLAGKPPADETMGGWPHR